jgi:hypothetical protein
MRLHRLEAKLVNLELKTRPKQLLGSLPLDFALSKASQRKLLALLGKKEFLFKQNMSRRKSVSGAIFTTPFFFVTYEWAR